MYTGMCVCVFLGCLKTSVGITQHFSGLNTFWANTVVWCRTLYYLQAVRCLLQATQNWLITNGFFRSDWNLQHTMFVWLFDLYMIYMHLVCMCHLIANMHKLINLIFFLKCWVLKFFIVCPKKSRWLSCLQWSLLSSYVCKERESSRSPLLCCVVCLLWGLECGWISVMCLFAKREKKKAKLPVLSWTFPLWYLTFSWEPSGMTLGDFGLCFPLMTWNQSEHQSI